MSIVKPVLRAFDYAKAMEFYVDWLGFQVDWEHRPADTPFYLQLSMRDIILHLSEHHGDASPGASVYVDEFTDLRAYHQLLIGKQYKYNRPGLEEAFYDPSILLVTVNDPFYNKIIFAGKK
jgi:catechol 2,3-dioxygenase-like lactoylglutathione lyase family enzyme